MRKLDNKLTETIGDDVSDNLQEETYIGLKQKLIKEYRKKTSEELEDELLSLKYGIKRLDDENPIYDLVVHASSSVLAFVAIVLSILALLLSVYSLYYKCTKYYIEPTAFVTSIELAFVFSLASLVLPVIISAIKKNYISKKNTTRFLYELKLDCIKEVLDTRQMNHNRAQHKRRHKHKVRLKLKSKQG